MKKLIERPRDIWLRKHNIPDDATSKFSDGDLSKSVKTLFDIQLLLAFGWEFTVGFRGEYYFISPDFMTFRIFSPDCERTLYETDDLDDFGENARIGENGEFYLKDVIDELEF